MVFNEALSDEELSDLTGQVNLSFNNLATFYGYTLLLIMAEPTIQLGGGNWAGKTDNLLGYYEQRWKILQARFYIFKKHNWNIHRFRRLYSRDAV